MCSQPEKLFSNMKAVVKIIHLNMTWLALAKYVSGDPSSRAIVLQIAVLEDNTNGMQEILVGWQIGAKAVTRIWWAPQQDTPHV